MCRVLALQNSNRSTEVCSSCFTHNKRETSGKDSVLERTMTTARKLKYMLPEICFILTSKISGGTQDRYIPNVLVETSGLILQSTQEQCCVYTPDYPRRCSVSPLVPAPAFTHVGMFRHGLWRGELCLQGIPSTTPVPTGHVLCGQEWEEQCWTQFT